MKAMTVKEFDKLSRRDFENGAVRDSIRIALEEREQQKPRVSMFQIAILLELLSLATKSVSKKEVVKTWVEEIGVEVEE